MGDNRSGGQALRDATSGIRVVEMGRDALCNHYYGFGNLSNQIDLRPSSTCGLPSGTRDPAHDVNKRPSHP